MLSNFKCWKRLKSPLDCKEIKPVKIKDNQHWIFIERTDAEAEDPILWPPDAKSQLIGKYPDAGGNWGQEKKVTEDEMVGWHYWLNGCEFEQTPGDSEEQGSLASYSSWSCRIGYDSNSTTTRLWGLPWWLSGKESASQCRKREFDPWVRKISWRRKWQPIAVFLPGKSRGQATVHGVAKESDTA